MVDVVLQATQTLSGTDGFDSKAPSVANKIRNEMMGVLGLFCAHCLG